MKAWLKDFYISQLTWHKIERIWRLVNRKNGRALVKLFFLRLSMLAACGSPLEDSLVGLAGNVV